MNELRRDENTAPEDLVRQSTDTDVAKELDLDQIHEIVSVNAKISNYIQNPVIDRKSVIHKHSYYPFFFVLEMNFLINIYKIGRMVPLLQYVGGAHQTARTGASRISAWTGASR